MELINASSGTVAIIGDEARFRTDAGTVVRMARHDGPKDHGFCD